ncbi:MAG: SpoVG family protein [Clostridia bacterium]|nr:SpoVG family protein [Clostridia bacterium]
MASGKKGGAAMASPKERIVEEENRNLTEPEIKVRIHKLYNDESSPLRAFASANIGDYAVHGLKVLENDKGLWVSMPQTSYKDENGEKKYEDVFHATTAAAKARLGQAVIEEYNNTLEQSQNSSEEQNNASEMTAPKMQKM